MAYGKLATAGSDHLQNNGYSNAVMQSMSYTHGNIQLKKEDEGNIQLKQEGRPSTENNTGMPDDLKSGIENLSGMSMDDVKVHYNSDKPAQMKANAYAQGTDIHVASGQEKHLPHEAWHVVQQKQGRVQPTIQMKGDVNVNEDPGLEKEADVMGAKALEKASGADKELHDSKNKQLDIGISRDHNTAQLTRWRFNGENWEIIKKDEFEKYDAPEVMDQDKKGDEYDQNTGRRISAIHQDLWMKSGELESLRGEMEDQIDLWPEIAKGLIAHCEKYPGDLQDGLLDCGKLTFPSDLKFTPEHFSPGEPVIKDELRQRLGDFLISFTKANGQMAYLETKKWFLDETYKVVLEVNFYPDRDFNPNAKRLAPHKDTDSRNLFVNLIFNNPTKMPGTEWTMDQFQPDETRLDELQERLPQEEIESIFAAKANMDELPNETPGKNIWEGGVVEPNSYVSWIDELIWHSTPSVEKRVEFDKAQVKYWFMNGASDFKLSFYESMLIVSENIHGNIGVENLKEFAKNLKDLDSCLTKTKDLRETPELPLYQEILKEINCINWVGLKRSGRVGGVEIDQGKGIDTISRTVPTKIGNRPRSNSKPEVKVENQKALELMKDHQKSLQLAKKEEGTSTSNGSQEDELPKRSFIRTWVTLVKVKDV
ncbi:hypothetical protein MYP_849 [Sporocytophaga myxococcoides]|uniref:eCIS core domain-containing protein n=2 Tax=Sporocytophaga myxococcoides TaxID=153721 RepID=A0A098LAZ6_9BACT|nr:hypothetical protein MYP_849 [Sporocytophaga myxococcoides]